MRAPRERAAPARRRGHPQPPLRSARASSSDGLEALGVVAQPQCELGVVEPELADLGLGDVRAGLEVLGGDAELRGDLPERLHRRCSLAALDLRDVLRRDAGRREVALGQSSLFTESPQALTNCLRARHRREIVSGFSARCDAGARAMSTDPGRTFVEDLIRREVNLNGTACAAADHRAVFCRRVPRGVGPRALGPARGRGARAPRPSFFAPPRGIRALRAKSIRMRRGELESRILILVTLALVAFGHRDGLLGDLGAGRGRRRQPELLRRAAGDLRAARDRPDGARAALGLPPAARARAGARRRLARRCSPPCS